MCQIPVICAGSEFEVYIDAIITNKNENRDQNGDVNSATLNGHTIRNQMRAI